jgi:hypothetical protein
MYSEAVNSFHSLLSSKKKKRKKQKKKVGHSSNPLVEFLEINYFESDVVSLLALMAAFVCVMFCLRVLLKSEMQVKDHESAVDEMGGSTWVSNGCVHWWVLGSFPLKTTASASSQPTWRALFRLMHIVQINLKLYPPPPPPPICVDKQYIKKMRRIYDW